MKKFKKLALVLAAIMTFSSTAPAYAAPSGVEPGTIYYHIQKIWNIENPDITLGYFAESGLTENEYISILADKTVTVTATAENKESTSFDVTADENGNVVIPEKYRDYTNFEFVIEKEVIINKLESKTVFYTFSYNVEKEVPEHPNYIELTPSETVNQHESGTIVNGKVYVYGIHNFATIVSTLSSDVTFTETPVDGWKTSIEYVDGIDDRYYDKAGATENLPGGVIPKSVIITNTASASCVVSGSLQLQEKRDYTYSFTKEWNVEDSDLILKYDDSFAISKDTFEEFINSHTFDVTASGEGLEGGSFTVNTSLTEIVVPEEYKNYSTFEFSMDLDGKMYNFVYNVDKTEKPTIPEEITINASNGDIITLTKENNWTGSYVSETADLTFTETPIEGWECNVNIVRAFAPAGPPADADKTPNLYEVYIVNSSSITYDIETKMTLNEDEYFIEKTWDIEDPDLTLGYFAESGLNEAEYKAIMGNNTIAIKATADNKEDVSFEASTDNNGDFIIPKEYENYTNFSFEVVKNSVTYRFSYEVEKKEPIIPDEIVIVSSENDRLTLSKDNNWQTSFTSPYRHLTFTEEPVEGFESEITISDTTPVYVTVKNTGSIKYDVKASMTTKDYTYNLEKEWNVGHASVSVGYVDSTGLTRDEFESIVGNKTFEITASNPTLGTTKFEVTSIDDGKFSIPAQYIDYKNFSFVIEENNITYTFNYVLSWKNPEIPEEITINVSNGDVITLTKENNWKTTYTNIDPTLTFEEVNLQGWESEVNTTNNGDSFDVLISNTGHYNSYAAIATVNTKEYTYNLEKEWNVKETDIVLGYTSSMGLGEEEYKALMSNNNLLITASGEGLEDVSLEIKASEDGTFIIQKEYSDYTKFSFEIKKDSTTYNFVYNVEKKEPVIPEEITINVSNGDVITLTKENGWKEVYITNIADVTFTETPIHGWTSAINTYSVAGKAAYIVKVVNTGRISYEASATVTSKTEYVYNLEKTWKLEEGSVILGYKDNFKLTEAEYKELMANKELTITAKFSDKEEVVFTAKADKNGNVLVSDKYRDYTDFSFEIKKDDITYKFAYKVNKNTPEIPDSIKITASNGDVITLTKENNWKATYVSTDSTLTFTEEMTDWVGTLNVVANNNDFKVEVVNTNSTTYGVSGDLKIEKPVIPPTEPEEPTPDPVEPEPEPALPPVNEIVPTGDNTPVFGYALSSMIAAAVLLGMAIIGFRKSKKTE